MAYTCVSTAHVLHENSNGTVVMAKIRYVNSEIILHSALALPFFLQRGQRPQFLCNIKYDILKDSDFVD